jgi:membrane protease YdiL (CAAX protease family)
MDLSPASDLPPAPAPTPRGWTWLAWIVILLVVGFLVWRSARPRPEEGKGDVNLSRFTLRFQGRYFVGLSVWSGGSRAGEFYAKQLEPALSQGGADERLRLAVLAGELQDFAEARKVLRKLHADEESAALTLTEEQRQARELLERLYAGYEDDPEHRPVLDEEEQAELKQELDWFGELALAPPNGPDPAARDQLLGSARWCVVEVVAAFGLGGVALLVGAILLFLAVVLVASRQLRSGIRPGIGKGSVYAETFALYLVLFLNLSVALEYVAPRLPRELNGWWLALVPMGGSLLALGWPVLRGVSWTQVCRDIGWVKGRWSWLEPFAGLAGYLATLPVVVLAFFVVVALMALQKWVGWGDPFTPGGGPSHPVVKVAGQSSPWVWLQVFLVACVGAPIVEETMFRGVFYRHLREATGRWGTWSSVAISALANGFIFAIIHPQGILGVPVLMTLGSSFALIREWRDTLIPNVCAHALNNGLALLFLLFLTS